MERILREVAEIDVPDIIFGDAFGNEEAVRAVAADYPDIAFVFGSGGGPAEPNLSVFDNWIHEPAYLSGMLAGGLTKSGVIGVVGGMPVPEVNRLVNAFIAGAEGGQPRGGGQGQLHQQLVRPGRGQGSRPGPDRRRRGRPLRRALRRHRGRRRERRLRLRQHERPERSWPPTTSSPAPVWNMQPTVEYVVNQVDGGTYTAQDLKDFSMFAKGGAALAPIATELVREVPAELVEQVTARESEIKSGIFRVDINESTPAGSVIPASE